MGTSIERPEIPDVSSAGGSSQVDGLDPRGEEHLGPDRFERAVMRNVISPADIGVTYDMIGGLHDTKEALRQCVTYPLKFPHLYSEGIAGDCVKGVLLFGPPGTGKTMLAKAVATEGGATFLSVDAGLINQKYHGESEKVVKAVFRVARELAPCVIYIDEMDSVLGSRDSSNEPSWVTATKTTLMQEWDGLRTTTDRVLVIASTNRPYALDQAVLRRLPRRILVDLPDAETREEILHAIMGNNRMAPTVDLSSLAKRLEGYTGSDIREICREAVARIAHEEARKLEQEGEGKVGLEALRSHRLRDVTNEDFSAAMQKLSKSVASNSRELEKVRYWNKEFGEGSGR
jgi:SpoVK/Ycf46/Vps4 family AAA+-type ATPase